MNEQELPFRTFEVSAAGSIRHIQATSYGFRGPTLVFDIEKSRIAEFENWDWWREVPRVLTTRGEI